MVPPSLACQISMGESELRGKLRPVFDRFDLDGSGAVSSSEMSAIINHLGMQVTPAQLSTLMTEADPDSSGEIDFDEVRDCHSHGLHASWPASPDAAVAALGAFLHL